MLITEVRLENIKSFQSEQAISLRPGVNALIGANGAGKSTLVEAIGAALFGELPYKQDEFVRRGARSGRVAVRFVSRRDGREYQAVRQFGRGAIWYIYDEDSGLRLAEGERATSEWLREHLAPGSPLDLKAFFRENIGPPQGTLTAPFLGTPAERKARFAPLLQVDGFDRAFHELLPAKQHIQAQRSDLERAIASLETRLERRAEIESAQRQALRRGLEAERQLLLVEAELRETVERREALDRAEAALAESRAALTLAQQSLASAEREQQRATALVAEADQARQERDRLRPAYERFQQLESALAELETQRIERDAALETHNGLLRQRERLEQRLQETEARLQQAEQALQDLRQLALLLPDRAEVGPARSPGEVEERFQRALEQAQLRVNQEVVAAEALAKARQLVREEQPRREQVRQQLVATEQEIQRSLEATPLAERLDALAAAAERAQRAYADARAALELTQRARRELATGLCPILQETCQNVAGRSGGDLDGYFTQQLELGARAVASSQAALAEAERELAAARAAAQARDRLPDLRARQESLGQQEARLAAALDQARRTLEAEASAPARLTEAKRQYQELSERRARAHHLRTVADQARRHRQDIEEARQSLAQLDERLGESDQRLQPFKGLDNDLRARRAERDAARAERDRFLRLEQVASALAERQQQRAEAGAALAAASQQLATAQSAVAEAAAAYDEAAHRRVRAEERALVQRSATLQAEMQAAQREAAERAQELEALSQTEHDLAEKRRQHEELGEALLLAEQIRQSLRQAGPQIIRALLARVSEIATRAFADVMGDHSLEIEWREDYEVVVRQSGVERTFRQLSGGEQMAAALAVRMALHHMLGNLRLLILDEPTTNMDDARRANLAQQVEQLKGYDQIILVSHSDEFDGMFGHIIHLRKAHGRSTVVPETERAARGGRRERRAGARAGRGSLMLYPAAVNQALRRDGPRLAELAEQRHLDATAYAEALGASAALSADEIERRLAGLPWPGARPSEEHDRTDGWCVDFSSAWTNHQQAIEWAQARLRGVWTVAVDGSEIKPTNEYNLRVGAVQVLTYENPHRGGHYRKHPHFELVLPGREDVSLRRFICETEALVEAIRRLEGATPPPVVLFDGTLVLSFTSDMTQDLAMRYINALLDALRASARYRVPLVGYVDASDAKDLCSLLGHLASLGSPRQSPVTDAQVLAPVMDWGVRTKALVCARDDRVLARYRGADDSASFQDELCFVYLKTTGGGPPARLDVPRWLVRDSALLDHVVDVVRAEVIVGNGYPLALSTADRGAVLRGRDRELFYRALERYAEDTGGLRQSAKATSKRRRRV